MSKTPPIPKEQRSGHGGQSPAEEQGDIARDPSRDRSGLNLREQDRFGNTRQNVQPQHHVQDR